jgi:hypothetical protein
MSQAMTFAGVPVAVALSFVLALGVEVVLIGSFIRLMARAAAQLEEQPAKGHKSSVR